MALLEVSGLEAHFFTRSGVVRAVDGVSFRVERGEVLGVVGESGSGKSVTGLSLLRLLDPPGRVVAGQVVLEDERGHREDLLKASEARMREVRGDRIAMIFQDPMTSLNPYLRVGAQLVEVLELHRGMGRAEARRKAIEMLGAVGIPSPEARIDAHPHELSGGMRQRVLIAMALLCDPALLIADEPTTALDVTIQAQILELIRGRLRNPTPTPPQGGARKERERERDGDGEREREFGASSGGAREDAAGMGVILITHDLGVIAGMADRVLVMYAGRVVEEGPVEAIFADPRHPYTIGLRRSLPRLDDAGGRALQAIPGLPPSAMHLPPGCPFHPRCAFAVARCREEYPERRAISPDHAVRCHVEDVSLREESP